MNSAAFLGNKKVKQNEAYPEPLFPVSRVGVALQASRLTRDISIYFFSHSAQLPPCITLRLPLAVHLFIKR